MLIIKKNRKSEEFDMEKLKTGIINASLDAKTPLNEADANLLTKEIFTKIKALRNDNTSSYEVFAVTIEVLKSNKFKSILEQYVNYSIQD